MKRLTLSAALVLVATPAFAVLASPYQRAAEFAAVLEAAVPVLDPIAIESVEFVEVDRYEVRTTYCVLLVEIVDLDRPEGGPPLLGPRRFEARAGEPDCAE